MEVLKFLTKQEEAEKEWEIIKKAAEIKRKRFAIITHRIKWALEAVQNRGRILVRQLK